MSIAVTAFEVRQSGRETTPGTAVAATSKLALEELEITPYFEGGIYRPQIVNGVAGENPGYELVVQDGATWRGSGPVVFSQLQAWLGMAVLHDAAPVDQGGPGPYNWTHTFDPTAYPSVATRTLERRQTDGTNHIDYEWPYAVCNRIRLSWALGSTLMMEVSGFARPRTGSTFTAGQSLPTVVVVPSPLSRVYIDSTWGNVGTTLVSGQVKSWSIEFMNGLTPRWAADQRSDLGFSFDGWNPRGVQIRAQIECWLEANSGQVATEDTAARAQTLRAIRIDVAGSGNETLQLDFLAKHAENGITQPVDDDGLQLATFDLVTATDQTNMLSAALTNDVATLV